RSCGSARRAGVPWRRTAGRACLSRAPPAWRAPRAARGSCRVRGRGLVPAARAVVPAAAPGSDAARTRRPRPGRRCRSHTVSCRPSVLQRRVYGNSSRAAASDEVRWSGAACWCQTPTRGGVRHRRRWCQTPDRLVSDTGPPGVRHRTAVPTDADPPSAHVSAPTALRVHSALMHLAPIDGLLIAVYAAFVLGIGVLLRRQVVNSAEFFMAGRSMPAWVAGLAFLSANLGAQEMIGMAASGAKYGIITSHFYWVGAIPAMAFVGVFMMP